ncbi:hypothetical protein UPYG_G00156880 [Umbra pygmaea]|uniref:Uncharacterized protein n=1 Tax=Umbra pygmaea TaxID=75934 RepID=A0ABD0XIZ8_UMBPY
MSQKLKRATIVDALHPEEAQTVDKSIGPQNNVKSTPSWKACSVGHVVLSLGLTSFRTTLKICVENIQGKQILQIWHPQ